MKKLFLTLLLLPTGSFTKDSKNTDALKKNVNSLIEEKQKAFNDPEYLKFILGNKLDLHIYGTMTPGIAQLVAHKMHANLLAELKKRKNHFEAGKSLDEKSDAIIVNTCATIEQNIRKNGKAGMISGNNRLLGDNHLGRYLTSCKFNGKRFFENACPCDFYKQLTDEQLEQLIQGTQNSGK